MNIATDDQRELLRQYERSLHRKQDGPIQRTKSFMHTNSRTKATLMVVVYFIVFAVSFQTSKADFEQTSSNFLEANNSIEGSANAVQKVVTKSVSPTPVPESETENGAALILPATDKPSEDKPSTSMQYTASGYSYGHCTMYVSKRRPIPQNWGNARDWLRNAKAAGFTTGVHARPGAIGQTTVGRYGHVVYVEQIQDGKVYVSEMNYVGWNRLSYRWVDESEFSYIY